MTPSPSRWAWELLGWISLGLGFMGIPLPLLPTTPFILLSIYAFSKSRPSMRHWILHHHLIGPPVKRWQEKRGISSSTRFSALGSILFSFSISIWLLRSQTLAVLFLAAVGLFLLILVLRLPIVESESHL
jgi:uncharacterized protein